MFYKRDEERDGRLLEELALIIAEESNIKIIAYNTALFPCLGNHIENINNNLEDPYKVEKVNYVKHIIINFFCGRTNRGTKD